MVTSRRGAGTLGCLFSILVLVALGYFGSQVGEALLRYYRFEDAMRGQLKVASQRTNAEIKATLRLVADSLGIPEDGQDIGVARAGSHLAIWSDYSEPIESPFHVQRIPFHPHAEGRIPVDTSASQR